MQKVNVQFNLTINGGGSHTALAAMIKQAIHEHMEIECKVTSLQINNIEKKK